MKSQPTLVRVLTPPPLGPTNVIHGATAQAVTSKALAIHLSKSVPFSSARLSPFKLHLITVHPNQPLVIYLIVPEGTDKKKFPKTIVVQHVRTKEVIFSMTLGDLAAMVFNYDVVAKGAGEALLTKQHKALKDFGKVQRLDFMDPSTLYWSGHGAVSGPQDVGKRWNYLLVQLQSRIVILNLRQQSVAIAKGLSGEVSKADEKAFQPIIANITQDSLGGPMSSNALAVSRENVIVGTTDGDIKLYNWRAKVVVQSTKIVTGKGDTIVEIISANKYDTPERYAQNRRRVVCLTKKGAALLMEIHVVEGIVHDISPPLARFEGGSVPTSMSKQDDEHTSMEHIFVQYCGFRDLLLWSHPSKNAKGKLLAWDLGNVPEGDIKKKHNVEPARMEPLLVMQFPYESSHTIFPGWFHESMPMESMACAAVTKEGDFQILVAPLYNSGSTIKNPYAAFPVLSVNLHNILQRDLGLPEEREMHMKVHSIYCPPLRDSSIFYFGTSHGILMVKMVDGNLVQVPGTRHAHLSANFGGMGKAVLTVKGPEINYGILEPSGGPLAVDPLGYMETKNSIVVYESPPPLHLPPEIHKRPVRLPPLFLISPSRNYLCCFWKEEMRYEVLHITSMLDKVTSRTQTAKSPVVASGNGVASFAWVGDDDVFSILYNPEMDLALKVGIDLSAPTQSLGKEFANAAGKITDLAKLKELKKLKDIASGKTLGKVVGTAAKLQTLKGLQDLGKGTVKGVAGIGKGVGKVSVGTLKMTGKVTLAATMGTAGLTAGAVKQTGKLTKKMAVGGTSRVVGGGAKVAKMGFKAATFGFGGKKKAKKQDGSLATADDDEEEATVPTGQTPLDIIGEDPMAVDEKRAMEQLERKFPWVELRSLVEATGADGNVSNITPTALGELYLRSGNRNPPTVLFGGPVLCVACKADENDEGLAYFYTKKKGSTEESASEYASSGPAFPCPDLVVWDDDGRLCAVIIQSMVSIYLSEEPEFIMLGTTKVGIPADVDVQVISARFIHGALFCSTRSAVQVIFLGDLDGGVCHLDLFTLASSEVHMLPSKSIATEYKSLTPPTVPMPLNYPTVLGFQNGSLIISTVSGVQAIPLGSPLIRIGALLGAGHAPKAEKWFDAVPVADHEALANFLERRGVPDLALQLSGISLETTIDFSMRYGFVDRLEEMLELYGLKGLRTIDMSRGVSSSLFGPNQYGASVVVCVSAYLLSQGRVELVRRLATECLSSGDEGRREAFLLASLLMSVDVNDSKRVMMRAVQDEHEDSDWLVGSFARENILNS